MGWIGGKGEQRWSGDVHSSSPASQIGRLVGSEAPKNGKGNNSWVYMDWLSRVVDEVLCPGKMETSWRGSYRKILKAFPRGAGGERCSFGEKVWHGGGCMDGRGRHWPFKERVALSSVVGLSFAGQESERGRRSGGCMERIGGGREGRVRGGSVGFGLA